MKLLQNEVLYDVWSLENDVDIDSEDFIYLFRNLKNRGCSLLERKIIHLNYKGLIKNNDIVTIEEPGENILYAGRIWISKSGAKLEEVEVYYKR